MTGIAKAVHLVSERAVEDSLHDLLALLVAIVVLLLSLLNIVGLLCWLGLLWFCEGSHVNIYK